MTLLENLRLMAGALCILSDLPHDADCVAIFHRANTVLYPSFTRPAELS